MKLLSKSMGAMAVAMLMHVSTPAAPVLQITSGKLFGAKGVIVEGSSYDVQFLDGNCRTLYSNCDAASDFAFHSATSAVAAATALFDTVFVDSALGMFDKNPGLTNGCATIQFCFSIIPYAINTSNNRFSVVYAVNAGEPFYADGIDGGDGSKYMTINADATISNSSYTYAVWTASTSGTTQAASTVSEPGSLVLVATCTGLLTAARRRRRLKRHHELCAPSVENWNSR